MKIFWRTAVSTAIIFIIFGINTIIFKPGTLQTTFNGLGLLIVLLYNQFKPLEKE
ncbi:hypothetical protein [Lysinibacillus sp. NPDC059133]|uniref:hypothetical protein n=1 Tax=Lysinibacillus sp. NPDC059133 TaxID=3346737 RepID=UPI0036902126